MMENLRSHWKHLLCILALCAGYSLFVMGCPSPEPPKEKTTSETTSDGGTGSDTITADASQEATQDKDAGPSTDREPIAADEPTPADKSVSSDEPVAVDQTPELPIDEGETCKAGEIFYIDRCLSADDYCSTRFASQKDSIALPYEIIDGTNFCKTKDNHFYLPGSGYGACDKDGDLWVTINGYRASRYNADTDEFNAKVRDNARCQIKEITAFVYHSDTYKTNVFVQQLPAATPLVETSRNDGQGPQHQIPVYSLQQAPLPVSPGSECDDTNACSGGKVCYIGHCVVGKRFDPKTINTLTKACVQHIDLNHNDIPDAQETPSGQANPKEFLSLLKGGYFTELHFGVYEAGYKHGTDTIDVYHIYERPRGGVVADGGLTLGCPNMASTGKNPDFWKSCLLRDDQQCKNGTGHNANGLSGCWMEDVQQATPSLMKCVTFSGTDQQSFFYVSQYGIDKNYTHSRCELDADITVKAGSAQAASSSFKCQVETKAPSGGSVGWACVSYKDYATPNDYVAGCVDECTESTDASGAQPCGKIYDKSKCLRLQESWGRGSYICGLPKTDRCYIGGQLCENGAPTTCVPGKSIQPDEVKDDCDGVDDDCDGKIDEDSPTDPCYTATTGCVKGTNGNYTCTGACQTGKLTCQQVTENGKQVYKSVCQGAIAPLGQEICNGKDDNCDGQIDEIPANVLATLQNNGYKNIDMANKNCERGNGVCTGKGKIVCNNGNWTCNAKANTSQMKTLDNCTTITDDNCNGIVGDFCTYRNIGIYGDPGFTNTKPVKHRSPAGIVWVNHTELKNGNTLLRAKGEYLYVADHGNYVVRRAPLDNTLTNIGANYTTIAGIGGTQGDTDGPGDTALLRAPSPMLITSNGRYLFIGQDTAIRVIDLESKDASGKLINTVSTIAGSGLSSGCADASSGVSARFKTIRGLALSTNNATLYVADEGCHNVREIDISGTTYPVTTIAGDSQGTGGDRDSTSGNPGTYARFSGPYGLANKDDKFLYVADSRNIKIKQIDLSNRYQVSTFILRNALETSCTPRILRAAFSTNRHDEDWGKLRSILIHKDSLYITGGFSNVLCKWSINTPNTFFWRLVDARRAGFVVPPDRDVTTDGSPLNVTPNKTNLKKELFNHPNFLAARAAYPGGNPTLILYISEYNGHVIRTLITDENLQ